VGKGKGKGKYLQGGKRRCSPVADPPHSQGRGERGKKKKGDPTDFLSISQRGKRKRRNINPPKEKLLFLFYKPVIKKRKGEGIPPPSWKRKGEELGDKLVIT